MSSPAVQICRRRRSCLKIVSRLGLRRMHPCFKSAVQSLVAQFADLAFRTEQPKAISRHEEERAKRAKQREELTKAEAGFRLMDVNKPLAMAMLEQTTLSSKSSPNRHHVVPPNGALAYFLKQHPHLAEKCKRPYAYKARGRSKSSQKSGASSVGRRSANRTSAKSSGSKSGEPWRVSYLLLSTQRKRHTQAAEANKVLRVLPSSGNCLEIEKPVVFFAHTCTRTCRMTACDLVFRA